MANTTRARKKVASPPPKEKKGKSSPPQRQKKGKSQSTKSNKNATSVSQSSEPTKSIQRSRVTRSTAPPDDRYLRQQPAFPAVLALHMETVLSSSSSDDDEKKDDEDDDDDDDNPIIQSKNNHNYKTTGEDDDDDGEKEDEFYSPDEDEEEDEDDDDNGADEGEEDLDSDIEIMCQNVMQANEYKNSAGKKVRKLANRKQYDKQRILDAKLGAINTNEFTGYMSPTIRPMTEVEAMGLKKNHTFNDKNILLLRIAEEANLRGIRLHVLKSNSMSVHVRGYKFVVRANFSTLKGWHCSRVQCREGEFTPLAEDAKYENVEDGDDKEDEQPGAEEDEDEDDEETDHGENCFVLLLIIVFYVHCCSSIL